MQKSSSKMRSINDKTQRNCHKRRLRLKATHVWCEKLMKRQCLSLHHRTTICQNLPSDKDKFVKFHVNIIKCQLNKQYHVIQIGNANEVAVL